jgi:hypothetical protein
VFWSMRHAWLEELYRHRVTNVRIDPLLAQLNDTLAEICSSMSHAELAPRFAKVRGRYLDVAVRWSLPDRLHATRLSSAAVLWTMLLA